MASQTVEVTHWENSETRNKGKTGGSQYGEKAISKNVRQKIGVFAGANYLPRSSRQTGGCHYGILATYALLMTAVNKNRRAWHIGREIPITMIVAFAIQTVLLAWGASWWARGISAAQDRAELVQATMQGQISDMRGQLATLSVRYEANNVPMAQALYRIDMLERDARDRRK